MWERRQRPNDGSSLISRAGFIKRFDLMPYPRWACSPAWRKLGSVWIEKPAIFVMMVAVPTKKIDALERSGEWPFVSGRSRW
jgi:hypothetical protein